MVHIRVLIWAVRWDEAAAATVQKGVAADILVKSFFGRIELYESEQFDYSVMVGAFYDSITIQLGLHHKTASSTRGVRCNHEGIWCVVKVEESVHSSPHARIQRTEID